MTTYKKIRFIIEAILLFPLIHLFQILPLKFSSFVMGKTLRALGRFNHSHKIMLDNLRHAFPEKTEAEINAIAFDCWENLGRVGGEFPKINAMTAKQLREICDFSELEFLKEEYAKTPHPKIVISAHYGNWELGSRSAIELFGQVGLLYRRANNPYAEKIMLRSRKDYSALIFPKGDAAGLKKIVMHLKQGGVIAMLADQKMSQGVEVEFFGRKVMAPSTPADLAIKMNIPITMLSCERNGAGPKKTFALKYSGEIETENKTPEEIIQEIYNCYETWIRNSPKQWLWQHNRWKK